MFADDTFTGESIFSLRVNEGETAFAFKCRHDCNIPGANSLQAMHEIQKGTPERITLPPTLKMTWNLPKFLTKCGMQPLFA